jgi:hypothetical protein
MPTVNSAMTAVDQLMTGAGLGGATHTGIASDQQSATQPTADHGVAPQKKKLLQRICSATSSQP